MKIKRNNGFTLIELLIATTIFSFIMLIATTGIIKIGQLYYKGVTESKTQEATRAVSDELSRSVQFAANGRIDEIPVSSPTIIKKFCLGDTLYTAYLDSKYTAPNENTTGLVAQKITLNTPCASAVVLETKQVLGENMRLLKFDVQSVDSTLNVWRVTVRVAYGDSDLIDHYNDSGVLLGTTSAERKVNREKAVCKTGNPGGSFCAVAQLDTYVKKRLN